MKIFFDTEFTGLHQNTTLISIGLVAKTGETFYAEFTDYDQKQVNSWIQQNVISNLLLGSRDTSYPVGVSRIADVQVKAGVRNVFVNDLKKWLYSLWDKYHKHEGQIKMWGDCLAYDWMLFCQPWGGAREIPECIHYIPFDLATLFEIKGINPDISRVEFARGMGVYEIGDNPDLWGKQLEHNALFDAKLIKACYERLTTSD